MISWKKLDTEEALQELIAKSHEVPSVIYKHSNRCSVSFVVLGRLEHDWLWDEGDVDVYFLDLVPHRDVSDAVESTFGVRHQSPQVLVIKNGQSVYDTSHGDISVRGIKKALNGNGNSHDPGDS